MRKIGLFIFLFLGLICPIFAHAEDIVQKVDNTELRLFSNGKDELILQFLINDGWHIYYQNPGEIGKPTFIENLNPENQIKLTNSSIPQIVKAYDIMDEYLYKNTVYYKLKTSQKDNINFAVNFVECADVCRTQRVVFELKSLPDTSPQKWQQIVKDAEHTFPLVINADFEKSHNGITLDEQVSQIIKVIPEERDLVSKEEFETEKKDNRIFISWQNLSEQNKLKNMLIIMPEQAFYVKVNYDIFDWQYFLYVVILAFIGGIILNAMPCVFPILSLKIFGAIKNYDGKRHWKDAFIYTFGVLCSFLILVTVLDLLKESGKAIGWGFQLQSPLFVALMMILFLLMFLYMVEALPFPKLANDWLHKMSSANMFLTGFFAVLIASPCTGPFMGAAIGYAFIQSDLEMYAVFFAMALGYALPFALVEINPHFLQRILPKPGAWMTNLKIVLAIPVLLTCIWLGGVLIAQIYSKEGINKNHLNWRQYNATDVQAEVSAGKKVFIDFTAEWCLTCMFNEKTRLNGKNFASFVENNKVELFKADLTESNEAYNEALNSYGRDGIPVYVYYENETYRILPIFFNIDDLKTK